jgi:gas vesicle protein
MAGVIDRNTAIADAALAFAVGTLLGAGIVLLYAPQAGYKTRRDIRQFAGKARNRAEAAQLELRHSFESIIGDISAKLQEGLASGADWTDSKISDLHRALAAAEKSIAGEIDKILST